MGFQGQAGLHLARQQVSSLNFAHPHSGVTVERDATVLTRYCLLLLFLLHVFLSDVLSLICDAVLCLELVFAELGQAHYK